SFRWRQNPRARAGVRRHAMKKSPPSIEYWSLADPASIGPALRFRLRDDFGQRKMFHRWKTPAALSLVIGCVSSAIVHASRLPKNAPEIFSIDPGEGPAGTVVKVTGSGFEQTRYVLFAAGRTGQQAKFKVLSDKELEVTAPAYLREGTSATVVVVTGS